MISKEKYLLSCLAEECAEVAQRATKAIRFGLDEVQPGQEKTNMQRLIDELIDIVALADMLNLPAPTFADAEPAMNAKKAKVEKFYHYSVELGEAEPAQF